MYVCPPRRPRGVVAQQDGADVADHVGQVLLGHEEVDVVLYVCVCMLV